MSKIHEPVKDFINKYYPEGDVSQYFGENPKLYSKICNSDGVCLTGHNGIDIIRPWGTELFAVEDGIVVDVKDSPSGYGKHIRILSENYEWTYGHNSHNFVKVGDEVKAGDLVALMGNTGFVVSGDTPFWKHNPFAGTHLHLGCRPIKKTSKGWRYHKNTPRFMVENYNNGFMGSIDFKSMLPTKRNKKEEENILWRSAVNKILNVLNINKPIYKINTTLKYGDRSDEVKELQQMLGFEGFFKQIPTGYYGKVTSEAVLEWQLHHKIDDEKTLKELEGKFFGAKSLAKLRKLY